MSVETPPAADRPEPFPSLSPIQSTADGAGETADASQDNTARRGSSSGRYTGTTRKTRGSSLLQSILQSSPPLGTWQAIGEDAAKGPTLPEIKNGAYSADGWSHEGQLEKRNHDPHDIHQRRLTRSQINGSGGRFSMPGRTSTAPIPEAQVVDQTEEGATATRVEGESKGMPTQQTLSTLNTTESLDSKVRIGPNETGEYPNGYRFPKKHTWKQTCAIYGAAFWKAFWTIKGFLLTIYALNVVAWGAMIFFLIIPGATPAMCKSYPDCNNKRYSARQIWIENCSQILTALFCVPAFGLLPWRIRDFYFMIRYQVYGDYNAHRRLAGFYKGWYRLPGSQKLPEFLGPPPEPEHLKAKSLFAFTGSTEHDAEKVNEAIEQEIIALEANPAVPLPVWSMPPAPLTGIRARPTKFSALATIIWAYILNTLFQVGLCVVMWGFNRFQRNHTYFTFLVALFITCGCLTGIAAGIVAGKEGKVIKTTEGIPVKDYDTLETAEDFQERKAKEDKKADKKAEKAEKKTARHAEKHGEQN